MRHFVSFDWLELYCQERVKQPIDADFVRDKGWCVRVRSYGTPQYKQMYYVLDKNDFPIFEVRRDPYLSDSGAAILRRGSCHIRITNRYLYTDFWYYKLSTFLRAFGVSVCGVSRVDVSCDFPKFRYGYNPYKFTSNYMAGRVAKMHQCSLAAYGQAGWGSHSFNSLKWGSPASMVTTKLYDKTLELSRVGHDKPYIRQQWQANDLPSDAPIWRVEFAIKPNRGVIISNDGELCFPLDLEHLHNQQDAVKLFQVLSPKYFDFRLVVSNRNGERQRKDRCPRLPLLDFDFKVSYKIVKLDTRPEPLRTDLMIRKRLKAIINDDKADDVIREAAFAFYRSYPRYVQFRDVEGILPFADLETTAQ